VINLCAKDLFCMSEPCLHSPLFHVQSMLDFAPHRVYWDVLFNGYSGLIRGGAPCRQGDKQEKSCQNG